MFGPDFYPTPPEVIRKMLSGIKLADVGPILEPSAGKGDIVKYLNQEHESDKYRYSCRALDIDAVEKNQSLRHILKGEDIRVIHDDFLTLQTYKRYGLIIMNPPFSEGDKHLLKALEIQKRGGKIICLLNADTLRNPYTVTRKDLVRKLEGYDAEVEFLGSVFTGAERQTDVEVALVRVDIPQAERSSILLDGLRQQERYESQHRDPQAVTHGEFVERIVAQYNFEVKAGLALISEYAAMQPLIKQSLKDGSSPIIKLSVEYAKADTIENSFVGQVRSKYWKALFLSDKFLPLMTSSMRQDYVEKVQELKHYDFSVFNILQIQEDISRNTIKSVEETILALFDELSHKHHWTETSKNVHYYDGWKTNKAWIINKKVIVPNMYAWSIWSGKLSFDYRVIDKLSDIEKVFDYLDGGRSDHVSLKKALQDAETAGISRNIQLKYFTVSLFKKGTCHIQFTNLELLKKFNLFGSQRKGWLPPSYGKVKYEDMGQDERAVIDDFEGKDEYNKVCRNKDYYLYKSVDLLAAPAIKAG